MTTTITPARLRDMRTLLDAAPVRYSGIAADCCDAAADLIETGEREIAKLRRTLIDVINRGTDGGCTPDVSTEFLCFAADEAAGIKRQRDEAKAVADAYEGLADDLMGATGTDNIADAVKAAVAAVEAAQ